MLPAQSWIQLFGAFWTQHDSLAGFKLSQYLRALPWGLCVHAMLAQSRNVQAAFKQKQSVSLLGSLCQLFCHFTSFRCIQELDSISLVKNELNMMAGPAKQNSPRAPKSKLHKTYKMCLDPGKPKTLNKGPARDPPRPSFWVKAYYMPSEFLTGSLLPKGSRNFRFPFKSCNFHWRWPLKTATFGGSKKGNGSETLP